MNATFDDLEHWHFKGVQRPPFRPRMQVLEMEQRKKIVNRASNPIKMGKRVSSQFVVDD